ncbi:alkene reductase [Myxococcus sp. K15C18031901]|uniref:alkene reductase n=1 Tax=Myxococcus dinghuensis TaxID=2906761 RepID=UPI0020A7AD66|nr:alkene reductase [Myxococcus dinghuensis]MCP3103213.1 alkene reductase [Myxococcus dinghuensis]
MNLFTPFRLGNVDLANRVVMAPMSRSRALGGLANALIRDYYTQRATAGLIISEGFAPSANGMGYSRIPGLYTQAQVEGWKEVTASVREAGGHMFAQLMHVGRIAHRLNLPEGARIVAPSAIRAEGTIYTDQEGLLPLPEPEAMSEADVSAARDEFVLSARNAIAAGFDGVELHGANGYLLEQFLHPHSNRREDRYGGNTENRSRFVVEVAKAVAGAIGPEHVGIRLSPFSTINDLPERSGVLEQYEALAHELRGLAYVHLIANPHEGFPATETAIRRAFGGPLILNGGMSRDSAQAALDAGRAELISFGRPFVANPDLVARLKQGAELAPLQPQTLFTPGAEGYVDYPSR